MEASPQLSSDDYRYIHLSLLHLGVVRWTKSSLRLERAIIFAMSNRLIPRRSVSSLYAELNKDDNCTESAIERSLRYVVRVLWECDPRNCSWMFYHSAEALPSPSVSEFLCLYVSAFKRGVIREWVDSFEEHNAQLDKLEKGNIDYLLSHM
ncbi:MAG: hypothetical protein IJ428_03725 [Clostridia bacterium]|nr:hypothetical protein [Clostridia bacterium]